MIRGRDDAWLGLGVSQSCKCDFKLRKSTFSSVLEVVQAAATSI